MAQAKIIAIAAIGKDRGLGKGNDLVYHIPDDFKRMHRVIAGHPLIMGRKTWDSLPDGRRPLPNHANIVVTRQADFAPEGAIVVHSVEEAIGKARELDTEKIFIFGGGEIYKAALPYTDQLDLTLVDDTRPADVYFPDYSAFTRVISEEKHEYQGTPFSYVTLER